MSQWFLIICTCVVLLGTLLPFLRVDIFWIRAWDFPRLQIAALGFFLALGWFLFSEGGYLPWVFIISLGICFGYQAYRILPYTPLHPCQARGAQNFDPQRCISLLIANVLMENRNSDHYLRLVAHMKPDILLAVETDEWWVERLAILKTTYSYEVAKPQNNHYGMAFFSKLPIDKAEIRYLVEDAVPSVHASIQLLSGDTVFFHGLHPRPPHPSPHTDVTTRDAELVIVGKTVKEENQPAIVAGDLNDVAWSHTTRLFQRISGLLDPRIGRGMYNSFHASIPFFRWPLDHVFHSRHFQIVELQRLAAFGSDHFPIYIKLCYEPLLFTEQPLPTATVEDRQEAEEKLDNAEEVTGRPVESPQEETATLHQAVNPIVQSPSTDSR